MDVLLQHEKHEVHARSLYGLVQLGGADVLYGTQELVEVGSYA